MIRKKEYQRDLPRGTPVRLLKSNFYEPGTILLVARPWPGGFAACERLGNGEASTVGYDWDSEGRMWELA